MNNQASFSAANVFPAKLLKQRVLDSKGRIMPVHVQFNPTNVCNFNCPFCSCANRKRTEQLSLEDCKKMIEIMKRCGTRSATITGGGEPLLYPYINEIIRLFAKAKIKVGLVTNGMALNRLRTDIMKYITWIRISASVEYNTDKISINDWFKEIEKAIRLGPNIDWAFSYVLICENYNYDFIKSMILFANVHSFTHIRIVNDILGEYQNTTMKELKNALVKDKIDDSKVIYQPRSDFCNGSKRCLISLLKPVIGPDGKLYPCCGTQYALINPSKDYEKSMIIGDADDMENIYKSQKVFDGSKCVKCYYTDYNWALGILTDKLKHLEFV